MYKKFFKRFLDVFIASVMIVLLSPVFIAVSVAIKLESNGPVFFSSGKTRQKRKSF